MSHKEIIDYENLLNTVDNELLPIQSVPLENVFPALRRDLDLVLKLQQLAIDDTRETLIRLLNTFTKTELAYLVIKLFDDNVSLHTAMSELKYMLDNEYLMREITLKRNVNANAN